VACLYYDGITGIADTRSSLVINAIPPAGPHAAVQGQGTVNMGGTNYALVWSYATLQTGSHGFSSANFASDGKVTVAQNGLYMITCALYSTTVEIQGAIFLNYYSSGNPGTMFTGTSRILAKNSGQGYKKGNMLNALVYLTTSDYFVCLSQGSDPDITASYCGLSVVKLSQNSS
jgi:hypothetical protein